MIWRLFIITVFVFSLASCGGSSKGPKSDADKVCDCFEEMAKMTQDGASDDELLKKEEECEEMAEKFEEKYKGDEKAEEEFEEAGKDCMEKLEEKYKDVF